MRLPTKRAPKLREYVAPDWKETDEWMEIRMPVPLVNPLNQRKHWRRVYDLGEQQKQNVHAFLLMRRRLLRVLKPQLVTLTRLSPGRFDFAGLVASMKHVQDAVANTLGVDDAEWKPGAVQWEFKHELSAKYGVAIRFWRPRPILRSASE